MQEIQKGNDYVKLYFYRQVFVTTFNIRFKTPCQETCKVWDSFKNDAHHAAFELHKCKADKVYDMYASDKAKSRNDADHSALTMDLQQALKMSYIQTETVFYLWQLWYYNFGLHDCSNNDAYMCVWPEYIASGVQMK